MVALDGERLFGEALRLARRLRAEISALPGLRPLEPGDVLARPRAQLFNELHVTFDVKDLGMTGYAPADWLRGQQHVAFELADHRRLMALVSHADNEATADRLVAALWALAEYAEGCGGDAPRSMPGPSELCSRGAKDGDTLGEARNGYI